MCELLVRVVDKVNEDPYLDAKCLKRGDVVVICEDDWQWSTAELKNPDWRIIRLPGIAPDELELLLRPEVDADPKNPSAVLQRRAHKVDLDSQEFMAAKSALDDVERKTSVVAFAVDAVTVLSAAVVSKQRLLDPNVFEPLTDTKVP